MESIFHRTSIRQYQVKTVELEKIEMLLKAAMAAPSAGNQQPWEFYVVTDRKKLSELAACSPYAGCAKEAPLAIVPCYREDVIFPEYAQIDMSACTENLLLEADALGLGAVWLGIAPEKERMDRVRSAIGIPKGLHAFAIVPVGYPLKTEPQQDRYQTIRVHYIDAE